MLFEENDNRTPRERVGESLLRQMLAENDNTEITRMPRQGMTRNGRYVTGRSGSPGTDGGCGCNRCENGGCGNNGGANGDTHSWGLYEYPLGSVYAPIQIWRGLYDLETGFDHGTIFRELDLPFTASGGMRGGSCRG